MSLYSIISNGLNTLGNNKTEFYDNTHEYSSLRDFERGLGSKKNIISLKNDTPQSIIISCRKDTKIDDYFLNRLNLVKIERHDKESLHIEFENDVSSLVDQCNQLPNLDKAYKLSRAGHDILKAIGGWSNLYTSYILDDNIFLAVEDVNLLDEGLLQSYGATDFIVFDKHRVRINMGELSPYLTKLMEVAIIKDFFTDACKYIQALGGHDNIGRMKSFVTHINFSINDMDLVKLEELEALKPVKVSSDERHYILHLGQFTDLFSKLLHEITAEDIQKTVISQESIDENLNAGISIVDKRYIVEETATCSIYAPVTGKTVRLSSVNDEVFSNHVLGLGVAIEPTGDTLYAPFDGIILLSGSIKHALHIKSDSGVSMLLHVGINTIHSNSEHFKVLVNNKQMVKKGDPLITFDLEQLQKHDIDTIIPLVVTQANNRTIRGIKYNKDVTASEDTLFTLN